MKPRNRTILIVNENSCVLKALGQILRNSPLKLLYTKNAVQALQLLERNHVDVVITDLNMPDMTGLELLKKMKQSYPMTVRIMLTGFVENDTLRRAVNEGEIFRFIPKPFHPNEVMSIVSQALDKCRMLESANPIWHSLVKEEVDAALEAQPSEQKNNSVPITISEQDFTFAWKRVLCPAN